MDDFEDKSKNDFASVFWPFLRQLWSDFKNWKTGLQLRISSINLWLPVRFLALWERKGVDAFWRSGSLRVNPYAALARKYLRGNYLSPEVIAGK